MDWLSALQDTGRRLLQKVGPMSRYYILTEILEKPKSDPEVAGLRKSLIEEIIATSWRTARGATRCTTMKREPRIS